MPTFAFCLPSSLSPSTTPSYLQNFQLILPAAYDFLPNTPASSSVGCEITVITAYEVEHVLSRPTRDGWKAGAVKEQPLALHLPIQQDFLASRPKAQSRSLQLSISPFSSKFSNIRLFHTLRFTRHSANGNPSYVHQSLIQDPK